jgi:hypothetical protein
MSVPNASILRQMTTCVDVYETHAYSGIHEICFKPDLHIKEPLEASLQLKNNGSKPFQSTYTINREV